MSPREQEIDQLAIVRRPEARAARTCPLQLGDDWPGVFIRGDEAFGFAHLLRNIDKLSPELQAKALKPWIELLRSCYERGQTGD